MPVRLIDHTPSSLSRYVAAQINNLIPDGCADACREHIDSHIEAALIRTLRCVGRVRMWRQGEFNYLHSSQYCIFLYYLANTIWKATGETDTPTRLFLVNKALNGIDIFYEIEMPDVFFIGHSVGIVLAKATYGEFLVLYQNSTVGKSGGVAPAIGARVIIHPNCAIIGRSRVADGTILSQGTSVINQDTEPDRIAFGAGRGKLLFKVPEHNMIGDYFRI